MPWIFDDLVNPPLQPGADFNHSLEGAKFPHLRSLTLGQGVKLSTQWHKFNLNPAKQCSRWLSRNLCISDSTVSTSCVNLRFRNTLVFHWYTAHGCFVFIDISPSTFSDFRIPFVCTSIPTWHQLHSQTGTMIGKPSSGVHMSSVKQTHVGWWLVGGLWLYPLYIGNYHES